MTATPNLALPYIAAAQAQKHVTHNEALRMLDALVMPTVIDRDLSAPPGAPAEGDRYIVKAPGTGAFAGKDNQIAHYADGGWAFYAPRTGWICLVRDENALLAWDGDSWEPALSVLVSEFHNLTRLGIGTTADATNPLAAKLNNVLVTAKTVGEGGTGDLRCKLDKEAAANTLSLLFQTGFSGRAEIGLAGDDDLRIKVSADGASWRDSLVLDRTSGRASFPNGVAGLRELLSANRTYYVRSDGSDANDGLSNTAGGAFLTIQKAIDTAAALDCGIYNVTIQVANGTYSGANTLKSYVGAGPITIVGNEATPANVTVNASGAACFKADAVAGKWVLKGLKLGTTTTGHAIEALNGSTIDFQAINFGAVPTPFAHLFSSRGARITATGAYAISAAAYIHAQAFQGGLINTPGVTVTITGTPAFGFYAYATNGAGYYAHNVTFSGGATGNRYNVTTNAWIDTVGGGANYFPGNAAGAASSGGQYT